MADASPARVVIAMKWLANYEVEFLARLRDVLREHGVHLDVVCGSPHGADAARGDAVCPDWAVYRANRVFRVGRAEAVWQPCWDVIRDADLVVVEQASRLLLNAYLLGRPRDLRRPRIALWGHGANLDRDARRPVGEFVKRLMSRRADWWFAYTEGSRRRVLDLGYPAERITVVQNATSTEGIRAELDGLDPERVAAFRRQHKIPPEGPVGLYLGSLYARKRLDYVVAAADAAYRTDEAFRLIVAGDGPDRRMVDRMAVTRPHMCVIGRVGAEDKAVVLSASTALMLPHAGGLAILDAFAAGLPVVLLADGNHGPESEYVRHGFNGIVVPAGTEPDGFADAVLTASDSKSLSAGAYESGGRYTMNEMVERFAGGVLQALGMSAPCPRDTPNTAAGAVTNA